MPSASWEDLAADKRARLEKSIPDEWKIKSVPTEGSVIDLPEKSGILSPSEIKITNSSATELVAQLANGTSEIHETNENRLIAHMTSSQS